MKSLSLLTALGAPLLLSSNLLATEAEQWHYSEEALTSSTTRYQASSVNGVLRLYCDAGVTPSGVIQLQLKPGSVEPEHVQQVNWRSHMGRRSSQGILQLDATQMVRDAERITTPYALLSFEQAKLLQLRKQGENQGPSNKYQGVDGEVMKTTAEQWRLINQMRKADSLTLLVQDSNDIEHELAIGLNDFAPVFQKLYYQCDYLVQQEKNGSGIVM